MLTNIMCFDLSQLKVARRGESFKELNFWFINGFKGDFANKRNLNYLLYNNEKKDKLDKCHPKSQQENRTANESLTKKGLQN